MDEAAAPQFRALAEVAVGSATHRGHRRTVNEDSLLALPHVYVVADGMGGHAAGDRASAIVVEELQYLAGKRVEAADVSSALRAADARVRALSAESPAGTTVTGAFGVEQAGVPYWLIANLGDSRVYQLADGVLSQVSVDHSVVQELLDSGELDVEAARVHPQRHVVTRAIGAPEALEPDYWLVPAVKGERLLICSDGLTLEVGDDQLAAVLQRHAEPQAAAEALLALALDAGGRDNITVVVLDVLSTAGDDDADQTLPRGHEDAVADETQPRMPVAT